MEEGRRIKIERENGYIIYSTSDMNENELVIDMVETYEHGKGTASELIKEVAKVAEKEGKDLTLCAYPQDDTVTLNELISIYEHLGFEVEYDNGEEALMRYRFI